MKKIYTLGILLACACLFATQLKAQNSRHDENNGTAKLCEPVASVECIQVYNDAVITWNAPSSDINYYNIFKNGTFLESSTATEYTDVEPGVGLYEYCIEAIYNDGCVAEQTCQEIEIIYFEPEIPYNLSIGQCPEPHYHLYWEHSECFGGGTGEGEWIQYDSGVASQGIGGAESFSVAVRWDEMMAFDQFAISKIKLHVSWAGPSGERASIILKIWEGENAVTEVMSKNITDIYTPGGWSEIELDSPHTIDGSKELWIGYEVVDGGSGYPASIDQSIPTVDGYGNMLKLEEWESLTNYSIEGNWNIQVNIVDRSGFKEYLVYNHSSNQLVSVTQECEYIYYNPNDCFYVVASYYEGLSDPSEYACFEFDPPTNIQCTQVEKNAHITWNAPSNDVFFYKIFRNGMPLENSAETEYTDIEPGFGVFEYCVSAVYNSGYETETVCCELEIIEPVVMTVPEYFIIKDEYTSPQGDYALIFEWEHPQCSKGILELEFQEFEIFFQNENMNDPILISATNQCIDTVFATTNYNIGDCFWVEAVYNEGRMSSDEYCLTTGVGETEAKKITIYPNPASNIFYIESNKIIESVSIYNMVGQEVYRSEVASRGVFEINCSSFDAGIYLVKIEMEDSSTVERITIK